LLSWLIWIFKTVLIFVLPFLALLRGSVYLHSSYELGSFLSLFGGIIMSLIVIVIYMTWSFRKITSRIGGIGAFKTRGIFAFLLIAGFCIHGLFFISGEHLKNPDLAKELRELHPIIRMAVSTWVIMDKDLIITDGSRTPEDYKRMGLKTKKNSLHYIQKDGYSYALDLRSKNRSIFANNLLRNYMRLIGLRTLRHSGTDDHIHISLLNHNRPWAK
jgi:hypothetical protein